MSYFPCDIPFMSVDELIENDIHTPEDITGTNVKNSGFISIQEALDAVEESRRLNHHKNAKEACAHEYEHRHFLKILMDIQPSNVTEIKHGEWISVPEVWGSFDIRYYCSECGKDAIINNNERYVLSDYCPHCGAIMDNKRGNENG